MKIKITDEIVEALDRFLIENPNVKIGDIAIAIGVHRSTLYRIKKREINELNEHTYARLEFNFIGKYLDKENLVFSKVMEDKQEFNDVVTEIKYSKTKDELSKCKEELKLANKKIDAYEKLINRMNKIKDS